MIMRDSTNIRMVSCYYSIINRNICISHINYSILVPKSQLGNILLTV